MLRLGNSPLVATCRAWSGPDASNRISPIAHVAASGLCGLCALLRAPARCTTVPPGARSEESNQGVFQVKTGPKKSGRSVPGFYSLELIAGADFLLRYHGSGLGSASRSAIARKRPTGRQLRRSHYSGGGGGGGRGGQPAVGLREITGIDLLGSIGPRDHHAFETGSGRLRSDRRSTTSGCTTFGVELPSSAACSGLGRPGEWVAIFSEPQRGAAASHLLHPIVSVNDLGNHDRP